MYDIIRLCKRIFRKYPPKFWYTVLFLFLFLILVKPLFSTVAGIIDPPDPTSTPRPTPDLRQSGRIGEPLLVLDTYYTMLSYREYNSECVPLDRSDRHEPRKTAVVELWARHFGNEPVVISDFYLRDALGTNYELTPAYSVGSYNGICGESLSQGIAPPDMEIILEKGYGSHMYFYSREIPASAEGFEFTFLAAFSIPYPVTGTPEAASSKIFIPLSDPGEEAEPPAALLGVPDRNRLSEDRTGTIGSVAFGIDDAFRIAGDNDSTGFCLELLCMNISERIMDFDFAGAFDFAVVDDYGVAIAAEPSLNMGYNRTFAPDEIQKYRIVWSMEQASARMRNLYLRISSEENGQDLFIRIPFKESMLTDPAESPSSAEFLYRTPVPEKGTPDEEPADDIEQCVNTLPPILHPGDAAGVTYTPPVANRLRKTPGFSGEIIGMMNPGSRFYVMDGPVCADELYWYYVSFSGKYGWTAESDAGQYWLKKTQ